MLFGEIILSRKVKFLFQAYWARGALAVVLYICHNHSRKFPGEKFYNECSTLNSRDQKWQERINFETFGSSKNRNSEKY